MPDKNAEHADNSRTDNQSEEFLRLLMAHQARIFGFILTLVPKRSDAFDLMQETIFLMFEKFKNFQPGTNFTAWAISIARFKILKFREKKQGSPVLFDSNSFDEILKRTEARIEHIDERLKALELCLEKLNDGDRNLIRLRYEKGLKIKDVAQTVGRPIQGLYKAMARIHTQLQICIQRTLRAWNMSS